MDAPNPARAVHYLTILLCACILGALQLQVQLPRAFSATALLVIGGVWLLPGLQALPLEPAPPNKTRA